MDLADQLFEQGCEAEAGDVEAAADLYERAITHELFHVEAHVNLGRIRQEQRRWVEAEHHYRFALFARPTDITAAFNLGTVLEDLGREDEAIDQYQAVVEECPSHADAHFNLARLHERRGEVQPAFRHLKEYRLLRMAHERRMDVVVTH